MDVFVARQPIFDRSRRTYAYELLFRTGRTGGFDHPDPDQASVRILEVAFLLIGVERLTGGRRAFVNFTRDNLVKGYASVVPSPSIVIELLESVPPDDEVLDACRALREAGHLIALDDVVYGQVPSDLVSVADIVKVDFVQNGPRERRLLAEQFRPRGLRLLAEKIETPADYREALDAGYDYFQGYFFRRPTIVVGKDVPASRLNLLQLLHEIHKPEADLGYIETVIKREVSLTLKLLTYMNLAAFGFRQRIASVRQALMMLGLRGIRRWASVIALADASDDKPFELVVNSVVRAKFCEDLTGRIGLADHAEDAFFVGLFSLLDAILGRPLPDLLARLPVGDDVRQTLLGADSNVRRIYEIVLAYERGDWEEVSRLAGILGLDESAIPETYLHAVGWGNSTAYMEPPG
jgi:EAL and modified HD-GYP domain-containing signal transduction protein